MNMRRKKITVVGREVVAARCEDEMNSEMTDVVVLLKFLGFCSS